MEQIAKITYSASLDRLEKFNNSFDKGVLRIAYHGMNRKGQFIGKDVFEAAIPTSFNCPIVCRYIRETDSIGSHDMDVVRGDNGLRIVNTTHPVGVIPESAKYWWETIEEDDEQEHEYLCMDALVWSREEAYEKIKENKITDESMEIKITSGKTIDGVFNILAFDFLAFCLLESAEPCYESAGLEIFSFENFNMLYSRMLTDLWGDLKNANIIVQYNHTKNKDGGGDVQLSREEIFKKYELSEADVSEASNISDEELEAFLADFKKEDSSGGSDENLDVETSVIEDDKFEAIEDENKDSNTPQNEGENFALVQERVRVLQEALFAVKYEDPYWGETSRYWYVDCDFELSEVYAFDGMDGHLYGFSYVENGDNVIINFDSQKRKKFVIADFDEGTMQSDNAEMFSNIIKKYSEEIKDLNEKLTKYQNEKFKEEQESVFAEFEDLAGTVELEELMENCENITVDVLREKCFAIRGKIMPAKFSMDTKQTGTRIPVEPTNKNEKDPKYGDLFIKHGRKPLDI